MGKHRVKNNTFISYNPLKQVLADHINLDSPPAQV